MAETERRQDEFFETAMSRKFRKRGTDSASSDKPIPDVRSEGFTMSRKEYTSTLDEPERSQSKTTYKIFEGRLSTPPWEGRRIRPLSLPQAESVLLQHYYH